MGGASSKDRATTPDRRIEAYDIVSRIVPKEAESLLNRKVSLREEMRQVERRLEETAAEHEASLRNKKGSLQEELRQVETRLDEIAAQHGANRDYKDTARNSNSG